MEMPTTGQIIRTTLAGNKNATTLEVRDAKAMGNGVLVTGVRVQADDHNTCIGSTRCFYITKGYEVV
jgi:hypothetical protein